MKKKFLLIVVTILISICALFCMKTETFAALTCQHDGKVALVSTAKDSSSHYTKLCGECGEGFGTTESHYGGTATCTSKGKCTACGYEYKAALGHSYSSKVTKSATCTTTGVKTYTCTRCSNSYTEEISALGHTVGTTIVGYKNITDNIHVPEYECKNGCGLIMTRWYY